MNTIDRSDDDNTGNVLPLHPVNIGPPLALVPELSAESVAQEALLKQRWQSQKFAAQKRWLMLHTNELDAMNGSPGPLIDLISTRYAISVTEAENQVRQFLDNYVAIATPDAFNGKWENHVAAARSRWTKLNMQELHQTKGNKQLLTNLVRRRYGLTPDDARKQVSQFVSRCTSDITRKV